MCNICILYLRDSAGLEYTSGGWLASSGVDRVNRIGSDETALALDLHFQAVGTNPTALLYISIVL